MPDMPLRYWKPHEPFTDAYAAAVEAGDKVLRNSSVAIVGLARNCAVRLAQNLGRLDGLQAICRSWRLHIESNDCQDATLAVLDAYCRANPQATYTYQELGRQQYGAEFAGRRTIALAEYRDACQRWVRDCASDADYVIVVDFDAWGGWNHEGIVNGIGWLHGMPSAYGMASVSLFQYDFGNGPQWAHYDLWALRGLGQVGCYYDTYQNGYGGFGYSWLPPVGSEPVLVSSAFGGLCIYKADAYLQGTYDGVTDCEHVEFHRSIERATQKYLCVNPSQRTIMEWIETPEPCEATPQPSA
jgi:hypothetical protein